MIFLRFLAFFYFLVFLPSNLLAYIGLCCGKCGGNMPLNIPGGGIPETYEFRLKFSPSFMYMKGLASGYSFFWNSNVRSSEVFKNWMVYPEEMRMYMLMFSGGFSFTQRFFGAVMFMWERREMSLQFSRMMAQKFGSKTFSHHSQGLRDTVFIFKYLLWANDILIPTQQFSLLFGMSLPTGSILEKFDEHPNPDVVGKLQPYTMQLGSGTFDPKVGILYQGSSSPLWWGVNTIFTARPFKNELGYSLGHTARYDLYLMWQIRYDTVLEFQLNGIHFFGPEGENVLLKEQYEKFPSPLFDIRTLKGHKLGVTLGVQWQPFPLSILNIQIHVPILQWTEWYQMKEVFKVAVNWYMEIPTPASVRYVGKGGEEDDLGF